MSANTHDPRPVTTFFAKLSGLGKKIQAAIRPIAMAAQAGKRPWPANSLLELIKQMVEPY
jgi:hypothetical protein